MQEQVGTAVKDMRMSPIGDISRGFIHNPVALIDNPYASIAQRYGLIMENLSEARQRPIHADFEDAFNRVYASGTMNEVAAAIDLNRLLCFFYMMLHNNNIGRAHTNIWRSANAEKWVAKLVARFQQTEHCTINDETGVYTPAKLPEKVIHTWLN